jgi:hypothetical protein
MVSQVKKITRDWKYDVVSIGYPGPVPGCRAGNNANAFRGGFALWNRDDERHSTRAERTAASFDAGQGSDDRPRIS